MDEKLSEVILKRAREQADASVMYGRAKVMAREVPVEQPKTWPFYCEMCTIGMSMLLPGYLCGRCTKKELVIVRKALEAERKAERKAKKGHTTSYEARLKARQRMRRQNVLKGIAHRNAVIAQDFERRMQLWTWWREDKCICCGNERVKNWLICRSLDCEKALPYTRAQVPVRKPEKHRGKSNSATAGEADSSGTGSQGLEGTRTRAPRYRGTTIRNGPREQRWRSRNQTRKEDT